VLANVDREARSPEERRQLRLVALVHDTLKHAVDPHRPATGENHHGMRARRFAERYRVPGKTGASLEWFERLARP
jgi:hypothetical protein